MGVVARWHEKGTDVVRNWHVRGCVDEVAHRWQRGLDPAVDDIGVVLGSLPAHRQKEPERPGLMAAPLRAVLARWHRRWLMRQVETIETGPQGGIADWQWLMPLLTVCARVDPLVSGRQAEPSRHDSVLSSREGQAGADAGPDEVDGPEPHLEL